MTARDIPEDRFPPEDREVAQLRIPPHSMQAESSVLGALLIEASAWDRVGDLLQASDFYRSEHRMIFEAIGVLSNSMRQADTVTVYEHLQRVGKGEEIGGLAYLNSLAQCVPSASNIRRYAEIVRERSILRQLVSVSDEIATRAFNPEGGTVDGILDEAVAKVMAINSGGSDDDWSTMEELVLLELDDIQERANNPEQDKPYVETGLTELDDLMDGGLRGGQVVILGARPSMGKTALAKGIGLHVASNGHAVGEFSMEMTKREGGQRSLASAGHIALHKLRRPERMSDLDWSNLTAGIERMRNLPYYVCDKAGLTIHQLRSKMRKLHRKVKGGLKLGIVDYLQLMSGTDQRAPRHLQLEEITRGMKGLAKELDIPIIVLAQVNRGLDKEVDPMPRMADLKDSGSIEQDADVIVFMHRPIVLKQDLSHEWKDYAKCAVAKNRGGRVGRFPLQFIGHEATFYDWPKDRLEPVNPVRVKGGASSGADVS